MNKKELKAILDSHMKWLRNDPNGKRANLSGADLYGANLSRANLSGADLSGADLSQSNLYGANLSGADLSGADLYGANLSRANLSQSNLYGANLSGADLSGADLSQSNLYGANLSGADLSRANLQIELVDKFFPLCCPETGEFTAWKKANGLIVKLLVCEDAKRSSAYGRKCRCSKATVLAIENSDGSAANVKEVNSGYDMNFVYRVGETVKVENFDEDRRNECAPGIHFFITRQEAVDY